jgi:hypothetical protein
VVCLKISVNGTRKQKTEDTNKLTLLTPLVPENKQNRRYKQINFINSPDLAPAGARSGEYGGLLCVFPPEEHHERRTFCRHGGNPRTCDSGSAIDS